MRTLEPVAGAHSNQDEDRPRRGDRHIHSNLHLFAHLEPDANRHQLVHPCSAHTYPTIADKRSVRDGNRATAHGSSAGLAAYCLGNRPANRHGRPATGNGHTGIHL